VAIDWHIYPKSNDRKVTDLKQKDLIYGLGRRDTRIAIIQKWHKI